VGFHDMDLDDQVRAAMRRDERLASLRIDVRVRNGIVYLSGAVPSSARDHALQTVRSLKSVAAVVDQLHVAG